MRYILQTIMEAKINRLVREREIAIQGKDYDRVWALNLKINKEKNRMFSYCS